jgi:hypothetical protein
MAIVKSRSVIGLFAASAMLFSSTGAVAASAPVTQTEVSPWAVLSVMNGGAAAIAACGAAASAATAAAAAAAAQPAPGCVLPQVDTAPVAEVVPPVVPVAAAGGLGISPLLLGLAALAAGIGLYFAVKNNHNKSNSPA